MDTPAVSASIGDTSSLDHCEIVSRDSLVRREEEQGEVKFHIIINDGDPIKLRILLELKNIFRKQLPQMPKEYIVRLVFDRNHKSVAAIKQGRVIGGITYGAAALRFLRRHFVVTFSSDTAPSRNKSLEKLLFAPSQRRSKLGGMYARPRPSAAF